MPDPKNKILKVALPAELYEQLEKAAAEDDRELDRYVVRMVRQHLEGPRYTGETMVIPANAPIQTAPGFVPSQKTVPVGRAIPLAVKGGGEGLPIDLLNDNALNGEPEELVNPNVSKVKVPVPNPKAIDLFGASHRK